MHHPPAIATEFACDPTGAPLGELAWLALLDRLYGWAEIKSSLHGAADTHAAWQALMGDFARCLGASEIRLLDPGAEPEPLAAIGARPRQLLRASAPPALASGPAVQAQCASPRGFSAAQTQRFWAFCDHLYAALSLCESLQASRAELLAWRELIEALPLQLAVLDTQLRVSLLNQRARQLLAHSAHISLQGQHLCVAQGAPEFEAALCAFVADPLRLHQRVSLGALEIELRKLPHRAGAAQANRLCATAESAGGVECFSVLVLVHEWRQQLRHDELVPVPAALAAGLRQRSALSDRELPLAWNLALGMSLKQYAALCGRSIETVRAQLKAVYRKTGVAEQRQLSLLMFDTLSGLSWQPAEQQLSRAALPVWPQGRMGIRVGSSSVSREITL